MTAPRPEPLSEEAIDDLLTTLYDQCDCGRSDMTKWMCDECIARLLRARGESVAQLLATIEALVRGRL